MQRPVKSDARGLIVRPYIPDDLPSCLAVFDSNVPEYFRLHERPEFRTFLEGLPGPYLVVEDQNGLVVACGGHAVRMEDGVADLCWGMVRAELHRSGIGRLLTRARLAAIEADPAAREVALNTSQLTTGFYEDFGFVVIEVIPDGFAPGLDRCELRLRLPGFQNR